MNSKEIIALATALASVGKVEVKLVVRTNGTHY